MGGGSIYNLHPGLGPTPTCYAHQTAYTKHVTYLWPVGPRRREPAVAQDGPFGSSAAGLPEPVKEGVVGPGRAWRVRSLVRISGRCGAVAFRFDRNSFILLSSPSSYSHNSKRLPQHILSFKFLCTRRRRLWRLW